MRGGIANNERKIYLFLCPIDTISSVCVHSSSSPYEYSNRRPKMKKPVVVSLGMRPNEIIVFPCLQADHLYSASARVSLYIRINS